MKTWFCFGQIPQLLKRSHCISAPFYDHTCGRKSGFMVCNMVMYYMEEHYIKDKWKQLLYSFVWQNEEPSKEKANVHSRVSAAT